MIHIWKLDKTKINEYENFYEISICDKNINLGDIIIFNKNKKNMFKAVVIEKNYFKTLKAAFKGINHRLIPEFKELYDEENIKKYGIDRIKLVVNNEQKIHDLPIQNLEICPTYDYIKSGIKDVEGRKNTLKYQSYKEGDLVRFIYKKESLLTVIKYIKKYKDIEDYLKKETLKRALPNIKTIEEGIKIYNIWSTPNERKELRKKYGHGFLAIGINKI